MAPIRAVVLDAWPVIAAYQNHEPAASMLDELLDELLEARTKPPISAVNFNEVCYSLARHAGPDQAAREIAHLRGCLDIEPLNRATAEAAAWIKYTYDISLGDSFAAATAIKHGADLWTGDPELLCPDRVWNVLDLRAPAARGICPPRRRPAVAHLGAQQLVSLITGPLHAGEPAPAPRRTEKPAVEGPVIGLD